jgi:hypothetical protein
MPIQFACEHCSHSLTVSRRFAGRRGRCPSCREKIVVPGIQVADGVDSSEVPLRESATKGRSVVSAAIPSSGESARPVAAAPDSETRQLTDMVAVKRWVIYTQAALLGIVATSFFVFGLAVGGNTRLAISRLDEGVVLY